MALYAYQAYAKNGKKIAGTLDAQSEGAVREQLARMGFYPITIRPTTESSSSVPWYKKLFAKNVSLKDKILFTKQLAVLLRSGVPLLQALELLLEQFEGSLRSMLITVKDGIREGQSLADGLAKYPKAFDNIYVQLVRAGEATGKLDTILDRLTEYMERRAEMQKRVVDALTYPIIQLGFVVIVVIALLTFVVPTITEIFEDIGGQLPLTTRILISISNFLLSYYLLLLGIIIMSVVAFMYWKSTPAGARMLDRIKLKIPIISFFARMGAIVQFCSTLGMLIESGVNLAEALDIVVKIVDNRILADTLSQARDNIIKQGKIAEYLKQTGIFPPIATYLINTGEQSGQLDFMLLTVAKNYETELIDFSDSLASKIGPVMMIIMAVVVGFIVLSIVTPMMQMSELMSK